MSAFSKNKAIQPTLWYEGVAKAVLAAWKGREIERIMDQTDLDDRFPLLFVALAFRKRAIPILWSLLPHEGCSGVEEQTKLLTKVARLLPADTRVVLMADREYGSVGLFDFLHKQGWSFVIRMKKNIWCQMANGLHFQIGEIPLRPGTVNFEDNVCLVRVHSAEMRQEISSAHTKLTWHLTHASSLTETYCGPLMNRFEPYKKNWITDDAEL